MYLMDKLKEKFGGEDGKEIDPRELNYKVGNTSGMDVTGNIPSELAERVGQMAQRGGGEMEIQIENPTTFYIDRGELYSAIEGLDLDVSFHSDPNVGYTSAYRTGQGRGFNVTHDYFTNYLEGFTSFKLEKEQRDDINFRISRINPHISTDEIPALQERMAQDVSLDPFGFDSSDFSDQMIEMRDDAGKNMFRNKKFLGKLYYTLFLREARFPFEFYTTFGGYSDDFDKIWKHARHEACEELFKKESAKDLEERVLEKTYTTQTIQVNDRAVTSEYSQIAEKQELKETLVLGEEISISTMTGDQTVLEEGEEFTELRELEPLVKSISQDLSLTSLGAISRVILDIDEILGKIENSNAEEIVLKAINEVFNKLWAAPSSYREANNASISIDAKLQGLQQHMEIQQLRILERAYDKGNRDSKYKVNGKKVSIEGAAELVFKGYTPMFKDRDNRSKEELHLELLKRLFDRQDFERLLRMESIIFYNILPAWMSEADTKVKDKDGETVHRGWEAPELIWETIVENRWSGDDFEHWDMDLKNWEGYFRSLERNRSFRRDVAAASAAIYIWGHFTQIKSDFHMDGTEYVEQDHGNYTWIEWMNKYGVGVNFEAMNGNPQTEFKLWKPSHIVAACRAVNITARNELGELHEDLHGCPLKFTIDMEHTSSFGVDPWKEMEDLIEQEEWLADSGWDVPVNEDKPLSNMVRMYHLTKPGHETSQGTGHIHGPFRWGDEQLYTWLYRMVENGFAQSDERASIMYEVGGEMTGTVQKAKLAMNMIELDIAPEDLDPSRVDPGEEYKDEEEALIARFFGMDQPNFHKEWAKIEENAFAPLKELMQLEEFDRTWSGSGAIEQGDMRPGEWKQEEYR